MLDVNKFKDKNPCKYDHTIFTTKEVNDLWNNSHNKYVQIILMLIYSGVRVTSFLNLKKEDVHLEENYFHISKDKNEPSIRDVPIASVVKPFFVEWFNNSPCEYLLCTQDGKHLCYRNYRDAYWKPILDSLGCGYHRIHDTRHTCTTLMERVGVNEVHRKKILGHANGGDITLDIYTHLTMQQLLDDINQIHNGVDLLG